MRAPDIFPSCVICLCVSCSPDGGPLLRPVIRAPLTTRYASQRDPVHSSWHAEPRITLRSIRATGRDSSRLPQRILIQHEAAVRAVHRRRMRPPSRGEGGLLDPAGVKLRREAGIAFDAARLGIEPVLL